VAADYLDWGGAHSAKRKTDARTVDGYRLAPMSAFSAATPGGWRAAVSMMFETQ
jgi:hypothetical protein